MVRFSLQQKKMMKFIIKITKKKKQITIILKYINEITFISKFMQKMKKKTDVRKCRTGIAKIERSKQTE